MYFDTAAEPVFRPPSEADSFILRVTIGCSHNRCTYCSMYRDVPFRVRPMAAVEKQIEQAKRYAANVHRIFLADGDALVLETDRLLDLLARAKAAFPKLRRVSSYASPNNILRKTPEELRMLRDAGLTLLYCGLESGDDAVLSHVCKGVTAQQSIEAGQRIRAAGIKLSLMVILGLGGRAGSKTHALRTAQAVNAIRPNMLSALTLMLYPGSELRTEYESGRFEILSPAETMNELYELLEAIQLPEDSKCLFRSNHISNYAALAGTLPRDQKRLLLACRTARDRLAGSRAGDPYNTVEL